MTENDKFILRERKFKEELVAIVNNYNQMPAFIRKNAVQELLQQLIILEQKEFANAQKLEQEENKEQEEKEGDEK